MYYEDFALAILLGGHVQMCWILERQLHRKIAIHDNLVYDIHYPVYRRKWHLQLLYYKVRKQHQAKSQVLQQRPMFYYSGFVSRGRGIHSRYGR